MPEGPIASIAERWIQRAARVFVTELSRAAPPPPPPPCPVAVRCTHGDPPPPPLSGRLLEEYVTRLALNPRRWVLRRVESFTFIDAHTVRRRMSVDFELMTNPAVEEGQLVWIPVLMVAERDLRALDLC